MQDIGGAIFRFPTLRTFCFALGAHMPRRFAQLFARLAGFMPGVHRLAHAGRRGGVRPCASAIGWTEVAGIGGSGRNHKRDRGKNQRGSSGMVYASV
ncbi:MAG TPA: hypothetical protein VHG91_12120 [Longimicrobium sp.]|nr:hypothetical protein [Longimicrobium sp.]